MMRVGLIGSGNMARAMARGWGDPVLCSDGGSGRAGALASELGGRAARDTVVASGLACETMTGTSALLPTRDYDTLTVRREVTSPGGTTARGLDALERGGLRSAFQAAFDRVSEAER